MKKMLSFISLVLTLALCLQPFASASGMSDYTDVPANHWAYTFIAYVTNHGYMGETDDGKFEPDSNATRAMFITALYRSAGSPAVNNPNDIAFDDVPLGQWFSIPIRWAKNIGIVEGYDDNTFSPHNGIPREQMALLMYRYAQVLNYDVSTSNANPSEFPDFNDTPSGCRTAMLWAIKNGILIGRNGYLYPNVTANRAEVATCIYRFAIKDTPPSSISLNKETETLAVGSTTVLRATVYPSYSGYKAVSWKSDNTTVATVNSYGTVYAHQPGTATITVTTENGLTDTCVISVKERYYGSNTEDVCSFISVANGIPQAIAYSVYVNARITVDQQLTDNTRHVSEITVYSSLNRSGILPLYETPQLSVGTTSLNGVSLGLGPYTGDIMVPTDVLWVYKMATPNMMVGSSTSFSTLAVCMQMDALYPYADVALEFVF